MGRPKKVDNVNSNNDSSNDPLNKTLEALFVKEKEFHYNDILDVEYSVGSGSIKLDSIVNFVPGVHQATGISGGGKTSLGFAYMKNFLDDTSYERRAIYFRAERKESKEMKLRSGIKYVFRWEDWVDGTCMVVKSNVYELVLTTIRQSCKPEVAGKRQLFYMVDSTNALIPKGDIDKDFADANKVAGGALLASDFLRRMTMHLSSHGHICYLISQVRSKIKISQYAEAEPALSNNSGGHAMTHYSNYILEAQGTRKSDQILEKDENGKEVVIGHMARFYVCKASSDTIVDTEVQYPIRHGAVDGNANYIEHEIVTTLLELKLAVGTTWIQLDSSLHAELKSIKADSPEKHNGAAAFRKYLGENQEITDFLYKKCLECIRIKTAYKNSNPGSSEA